MTADFVISDADLVATCAGPGPRRGPAQREITAIPRASVAALKGRIVFVGPADQCVRELDTAAGAKILDARGCVVTPGFVDPHTHLVYAGDRRDELRRRLEGASYAEIAAAGGGIVKTVAATRAANEGQLVAAARPRLDEMLAGGTTTVEVKSGYGLTLDAELRALRAIRTLAVEQPVELSATFMGAHEVPVEYRGRRADYVRLIIDEMIPAVAREGLAEWCDVFCEHGVFTPEESAAILQAGLRHGLKPRIHADELALSGGAAVAAEVGARSADHLIFVDEACADRMAAAGVIATLLPAAAFFLKLGRFAPARMLIDRGVAVALATDLNPGGGFTTSMPFVMALACFGMNLTLEEALVGATLNAAASLDRHDRVGSLEAGKQIDAVIIKGALPDLLRVGAPVDHGGHQERKGGAPLWLDFGRMSVSQFLAAIASSDPTPGGGTAAAIAGAMGASLLIMVAGLPKTKTNSDDERAALAAARAALQPLAERLLVLADEDSAAYDEVTAAYRLPKATVEDKAARTAAIQAALQGATDVPFETLQACAGALRHGVAVARAGNRSAASDAGGGLGLLEAAANGAAANVRANVDGLKDAALKDRFAAGTDARLEAVRGHLSAARAALSGE